jgi:DNA-binding NtrC family response regulator
MVAQSTVMVTDHDADISLFMEEALLTEGYIVRRKSSKRVCVDEIEQAQPDLAIIDLPRAELVATMRLLNSLRARPTTRDIAVLVTSTDQRTLLDLSGQLHDLGCAMLLKPFDLEEFLSCVSQMAEPRSLPLRERKAAH